MPSWLINLALPYVIPVVVAGLSPVATEYTKRAVAWLVGRLPAAMVTILAGTIAEGANQLQAYLSGASLPPGLGGLIAVIVNEALAGFGRQGNLTRA